MQQIKMPLVKQGKPLVGAGMGYWLANCCCKKAVGSSTGFPKFWNPRAYSSHMWQIPFTNKVVLVL